MGGIAAPPRVVHEAMDGAETRREIDKLWLTSTVRCNKKEVEHTAWAPVAVVARPRLARRSDSHRPVLDHP